VWQEKRRAGTLRRPSIGALFSPALARTTIVTTVMMACCYAVAFGAIQQVPQIVPGVPETQAKVAEEVKKVAGGAPAPAPQRATATTAPSDSAISGEPSARPATMPVAAAGKPGAPDPKRAAAAGRVIQGVAADVGKTQELGGLVGRVILAVLAIYIVSRQRLIRIFQVPSLIVVPVVFAYCAVKGLGLLEVGIFIVGLLTVAQFSFWGNYLPRVYPVHLRGTGESFAANIGGRLIGTAAFFVTQKLAVAFGPANPTPAQAAHAIACTAAAIGTAAVVVGLIASFFLPEPTPEMEHE
jgi:hypothetical protein